MLDVYIVGEKRGVEWISLFKDENIVGLKFSDF